MLSRAGRRQTNGSAKAGESEASSFLDGSRAFFLLAVLFLVSAFAQIDRILPFILAESIKAELGLSDTQIGLITGIAFAAFYVLLSLPLARLADRHSPAPILVTCISVWSVMTALGGFATGFVSLAATRLGVAVGEAGAVPSAHALIARLISPKRRGLAIGIFSMGIPAGAMAGFGAGGAVSDAYGWRAAMIGAGVLGIGLAFLTYLAAGRSKAPAPGADGEAPYLASSLKLLSRPAFRWLFTAAICTGLAAAPFYAFIAPFLIRTHGFTTAEAGLLFGLLQGSIGIAGTLSGGRGFDRAVWRKRGYLKGPAVLFLVAAVTMPAALLFQPTWLTIIFMVPAMLAFTYVLPFAFGSAHALAGKGREAMGSSLTLIGSSLIGPAFGPLIVGFISDLATESGFANGLVVGLMLVPIACLLAGLSCLVTDHKITASLKARELA